MNNIERYMKYLTEQPTSSAGNVAGYKKPIGGRRKKRKALEGEKSIIETTKNDGHTHKIDLKEGHDDEDRVFYKTTPGDKNGHIHTLAISNGDMSKIEKGESVTIETSKDDGHIHSVTINRETLNKRLEESMTDENITIIEDTDRYRYFEESNGVKVFEMYEKEDHDFYIMGVKKHNPRYWAKNETTTIMREHLMRDGNNHFTVRYRGSDSRPLAYRI